MWFLVRRSVLVASSRQFAIWASTGTGVDTSQ
jgi:hypothetical protein